MKQEQALDILKLGHNVFLTGPAGSGKTFVLNAYVDFLKSKGVEVGITASTGIAATHINGITIHSWSGMGIKDALSDRELKDISKKPYIAKRFKKTRVLVIDEISMLHDFRLDLVDKVCKFLKDDPRPFGGMQIILCGDFFQLPPISRGGCGSRFVDKSEIWQNMDLKVCYLDEQHRHIDCALIQVLSDIRENKVGEKTLNFLRKRYQKKVENVLTPTKLYTHNIDVDAINMRTLEALPGESKVFNAYSSGNNLLVDVLKKSCLAPEYLYLKKGAVVMFVKNNFKEGYVNGTLASVIRFDMKGSPVVRLYNGNEIIVSRENWRIEEDGEIKAEISQMPLRLAWAITVHKSQGMSLDAAEIDLSKSFEKGMGYVALSRVRSFDGLKLMGLNDIALQVNEEALELDKEFTKMSQVVSSDLKSIKLLERKKKQKEFLKSIAPKGIAKPISTYEETKMLVLEKFSIKEIAERRGKTRGTIIGHLEKLINNKEDIDLSYMLPSISHFEKIRAVFQESEDMTLSPVRTILGQRFSYHELRIARLFVKQERMQEITE